MPYLWSEHAKHITTLFPPWTPGDGYSEEAILAAERRLGLDHLSDFFDGLIYTNAFCGGTGHFGWGDKDLQAEDVATIKIHWQEVVLPSYDMQFSPEWVNSQRSAGLSDYLWPIYRAPGIALMSRAHTISQHRLGIQRIVAVSQTSGLLDEAAEILGVTWIRRWGGQEPGTQVPGS